MTIIAAQAMQNLAKCKGSLWSKTAGRDPAETDASSVLYPKYSEVAQLVRAPAL